MLSEGIAFEISEEVHLMRSVCRNSRLCSEEEEEGGGSR